MDRKTAKELVHVGDWLARAASIVAAGAETYASDELLQEAGDSLLMKIGEAANRLARAKVKPPPGVVWADAVATRNWLIHQYDEIDRDITWSTLAIDLPVWSEALAPLLDDARHQLGSDV